MIRAFLIAVFICYLIIWWLGLPVAGCFSITIRRSPTRRKALAYQGLPLASHKTLCYTKASKLGGFVENLSEKPAYEVPRLRARNKGAASISTVLDGQESGGRDGKGDVAEGGSVPGGPAWGCIEEVQHCRKFFPTGFAERCFVRGEVEVLRTVGLTLLFLFCFKMGGGKMLIVQKYGGTSVGSVERIKAVARRVADTVAEGHRCVVVVSAMGDTTDQLVEMARQITARPSGREMDMLLTTGEQVSIALLSMALQELGQRTTSYTGWQAGIRTEAVHGKARIEEINTEKIMKALDDGQIVIVAGFQGVTEAGEITTLGRGGSDTTAVALAAALQADLCEIYTDVTGVFTTDPRVVPGARKLPSVSYDEMLELAILGAGVLHPRAVECAKLYNVKLVVRSSFTDEEGTMIQGVSDMEKALVVTGIAFDDEVVKVQVDGLPNRVDAMAQLFTLLAQERINVDVIVQSQRGEDEINLAFSITEEDRLNAEEVLKANQEQLGFSKASFESGLAKVSIVGAGMMTNPGVAAMCFRYLSEAGIPIKMVTTSEIKVSCVIPREWMETAVKRLHEAFGLESGSCAS